MNKTLNFVGIDKHTFINIPIFHKEANNFQIPNSKIDIILLTKEIYL